MAGAREPGAGAVPPSELKQAALRGVRWIGLARGSTELIAFGAGVTLAHLVPPAEFGRVAIAIVVSELALSLAAEGVGNPIVQRPDVRRAHLESATLMGLLLGAVMAVLTFAVFAPFVVQPLFGQETADLFRLLSPAFLLAGIRAVPQARLQRALDFRDIATIEIAGVLVGAVTSVGLAVFAGLDAAAYVLGILANGLVTTLLMTLRAGMAVPRPHGRELRQLLGFGVPAGFAGAAWVGFRNADYAILGLRLNAAQVGFYYRAYNLGVENEQRISGIISRVVFPVYSRAQDLAHVHTMRARIVRVNAVVIFPLLALFIAVAPVLVPWMFGERWEPAVLPAQILAVAGMAQMINNLTGPLLLAAGRPRALLGYNLCYCVGYVIAVLVAARYGLTAVCATVAGYQVATVVVAYVLVFPRVVEMPRGQLHRDVGPAVVSSALTLGVALPLASALADANVATLPALLLPLAAGGLVCLVVLWRLFPASFADVVMLARGVLNRPAGAPQAPALAGSSAGA